MKIHDDRHQNPLLTRIQTLPTEIRNILAGGAAGMVAKSCVAPIDRIKILYQITNAEFRLRNVPSVAARIVNNEGISALWKGNTATMLRVFPYAGIQFMVFEQNKAFFLKRGGEDELNTWESLMSGSVAGAVSVVCTYPLDLTRAQLAVLLRERGVGACNRSFSDVLISNYNGRGVKGLFRGVSPTLMGILPYSGIAFAINEQSKKEIRLFFKREPTTIEKLQCGALAGLFAQTLTYPMEVTRRRMQTIGIVTGQIADNALGHPNANKPDPSLARKDVPLSMSDTIRHLYKEQGMRGFYKGVSMNWMKGPVAFSISFTVFDLFQKKMERRPVNGDDTGRG